VGIGHSVDFWRSAENPPPSVVSISPQQKMKTPSNTQPGGMCHITVSERPPVLPPTIEVGTLEQQKTEKIETEVKA